jgi:predicted nucleic acid-binding protein
MVLLDTSIWLRYLRGEEPVLTITRQLLTRGAVLSHDFVYGELLIGDRGTRTTLLALLAQIPAAPTVAHPEMVTFVRQRKLLAQGLGWIDTHLLAAALVTHATLWTTDGPLERAATTLGVAYQPARTRS